MHRAFQKSIKNEGSTKVPCHPTYSIGCTIMGFEKSRFYHSKATTYRSMPLLCDRRSGYDDGRNREISGLSRPVYFAILTPFHLSSQSPNPKFASVVASPIDEKRMEYTIMSLQQLQDLWNIWSTRILITVIILALYDYYYYYSLLWRDAIYHSSTLVTVVVVVVVVVPVATMEHSDESNNNNNNNRKEPK